MKKSYHAFLSFSTNPDYKLSQKVESFLETFHNLKTPENILLEKLEICRDGSDFSLQKLSKKPNTDNHDSINTMLSYYLEQSEYLLVLCSNETPFSEYVIFEISWFLEHRGPDKILLAVTEGAQPLQNPKEIFPEIIIQNKLHKKPFYDFRNYTKKRAKQWEKVRDFEEELTNVAAHLNGYTSGQIMPLWHRNKLKEKRFRQIRNSILGLIFILIIIIAGWISYSKSFEATQIKREKLSNEIINKLDANLNKTTKFRLIEYALRVNPNNSVAIQELFNLYYYNQDNFYSSKINHQQPIKSAVFSTDGKTMATSSYDNETIKLFDVQGGKQLKEFNIPNVYEPILAFSPNENKLAIGDGNSFGSKEEYIKIWDIDKEKIVDTLIANNAGVRSINYSYDGKMVAVALGNGEVKVWDLKTKTEVIPPIFHHYLITNNWKMTSPIKFVLDEKPISPNDKDYNCVDSDFIEKMTVNEIEFSHNGKMLLTVTKGHVSGSYFIHIWDILEGKPNLICTKKHHSNVSAAHFSQNDSSILISSYDGQVMLWDLEKRDSIFSFKAHDLPAKRVIFSKNEKLIFSASMNNQVKIWDASSQKNISTLYFTDDITNLEYSDSLELLSVSVGNRIQLWDLKKYDSKHIIKNSSDNAKLRFISLSSDNSTLSGSISNDSILFWNIFNELDSFINHSNNKFSETEGGVKVSPDGTIVSSIFNSPREMRYFDMNGIKPNYNFVVSHPFKDEFVSMHNKDSLTVWKNKKKVKDIVLNLDAYPSLPPSFSPNGNRLAFPCYDSTIVIFDFPTKKSQKIKLNSIPYHVSFCPTKNRIAIVTNSDSLEIWDLVNLKRKFTLPGHQAGLTYADFSKDGNRIVTASKDTNCKVWDLTKEEELFTLPDHQDVVTTAKFSHLGNYIYTTSFDKTVKIWDALEGHLILDIQHKNTVWDAFLNNEENVISNLVGDEIIIFRLDKDSICVEAKKRFDIAHLTPELIDKYNLEKSFKYTGYLNDDLIKKNDEEMMSVIADYYSFKIKKANSVIARKRYFDLAISLYEALIEKNKTLSTTDYKDKKESLILEFNKMSE